MRMRSAVGVTALLLALPGTAFAAPSFKLRRVNALNGAGDAVLSIAPEADGSFISTKTARSGESLAPSSMWVTPLS